MPPPLPWNELQAYPAIPRPLVRSHSFADQENARRFENDTGEPRVRRIFRKVPQTATVLWRFTQAQFDTFADWHEITLLAGSRPFNAPLAAQGAGIPAYRNYPARFSEPYEATAQPGRRWEVSATLVTLVQPDSVFFTSLPYPIEFVEKLNAAVAIPQSGRLWRPAHEMLDVGVAIPLAGTLVAVLRQYQNAEPEELNLGVAVPLAGTLFAALVQYDDAVPDELNAAVAYPLSGSLQLVLVSYTNATPDTFNVGVATPLGGTLS